MTSTSCLFFRDSVVCSAAVRQSGSSHETVHRPSPGNESVCATDSSPTRTDEAAVDCRAEPRPVDDACTRIHTHDVVRAQTVEPARCNHANPRVHTRRYARPLWLPGSASDLARGHGEGCRGGYPDANRVHRRRVHGGGDGTGVRTRGVATASDIVVSPSTDPSRNASWSEDVGANVLGSNVEAMESVDVVFLTVKSHVLPAVLDEIADVVDLSRHPLVSLHVAAGVPVEFIEKHSARRRGRRTRKT